MMISFALSTYETDGDSEIAGHCAVSANQNKIKVKHATGYKDDGSAVPDGGRLLFPAL